MTQRETIISEKINKALNQLSNCRVFRNNVGRDLITNKKYGLINGSADRIGWLSVVVTPEMVGRRVALFLSVEVKADEDSETRDSQRVWHRNVQRFGGIAIFARSIEEAFAEINTAIKAWGLPQLIAPEEKVRGWKKAK